jgi:hypothetical protein
MSYIFEANARTIWSPSRITGTLFLSQVRELEKCIEHRSGLIEHMSDTVEIDFPVLNVFLEKLAGWANFSNPSISLLLKGVTVHLLALVTSSKRTCSAYSSPLPRDWIDEAALFSDREMRVENS